MRKYMGCKVVKIGDNMKHRRGCYSRYYDLKNGRGIKVLRVQDTANGYSYCSKENLQRARKEAALLRKAQKTGVTPKVYAVVAVKLHKKWTFGIEMQHLNGKQLAEMRMKCSREYDIILELQKRLENAGMHMDDLHSKNVIMVKGKAYVIDFTPEYVYVTKKDRFIK